MLVNATTVRLVIRPVAVVYVTVDVGESAFSVRSVLSPLSTVLGSITPRLLAKSIAETAFPLACVHCFGLERVRGPVFSRLVWVVQLLRHRLSGLLLREVLAAAELLRSKKSDQ